MIDLKESIKALCAIASPSGYEDGVISFLKDKLSSYNNLEVLRDTLGNLIVFKRGRSDNKLMIVAHCDEIGFVVKYIDNLGFVRFAPVGGVDVSILNGLRVIIKHQGKNVEGVIGARPIHFARSEKKEKAKNDPSIADLWIDIGASDKDVATSLVSVGDAISFMPDFSELNGDLFSSKSIDNRVGIATLLAVIDAVYETETNSCLSFVFSVQEELGLRGAITAGYKINPDECIAVDVTHATDYPNIDKNCFGDIRLGGGPAIPIGANFNQDIQNQLKQIAQFRNIKFQIEAIPGFSGTDIEKVQLTRRGVRTGLISIPCRYMHSPIEVASMEDVKSAIAVLTDYCKK